jgi:hypothetical protein
MFFAMLLTQKLKRKKYRFTELWIRMDFNPDPDMDPAFYLKLDPDPS